MMRRLSFAVRLAILAGLALLAACAGLPGPARPTPAARGGLYVDAGYSYGPISPFVYGSNTGPWQTVGLDQPAQMRAAGLRMIRWPGGNWGDEHDVTPGQVDEFIALARNVGAEPLIHVRLFDGTAEQAAALVRLVNVEKRYGVRYWAVGNEPDRFVIRFRKPYNVSDYARDFKAFRAAMKQVDPSIVVMGPEISQYSGPSSNPDATGVAWMEGFLKEAGADVDMVTYHRYPFGQPPATPDTLLADPPQWSASIAGLHEQIRRITGRDIPVGVTEANSDWSGRLDDEAGTNSHLNAIWWADVLGRLIRGRAEVVTQFCLGSIRSQGLGLFGPVTYDPAPLPTFEVYRLYHLFGTTLVHSSSDDDSLPIVAAKRDDGALTIIVINHAAAQRQVPIAIDGATAGMAQVWSFAEDHGVEQRPDATLDGPITLEPRSATLLVLGGR
jgi:hypothetical protein